MASTDNRRLIYLGEREFVYPSENIKPLKNHGPYFR